MAGDGNWEAAPWALTAAAPITWPGRGQLAVTPAARTIWRKSPYKLKENEPIAKILKSTNYGLSHGSRGTRSLVSATGSHSLCDTGDCGAAGYREEKGPSAPRTPCGTSPFREFTKYALSLLVLLPVPTKDCKVCLRQ